MLFFKLLPLPSCRHALTWQDSKIKPHVETATAVGPLWPCTRKSFQFQKGNSTKSALNTEGTLLSLRTVPDCSCSHRDVLYQLGHFQYHACHPVSLLLRLKRRPPSIQKMLIDAYLTILRAAILFETIHLSYCSQMETSLSIPGNISPADTSHYDLKEEGRGMHDDYDMVEKPKSKPWLGYYDFLITEGSYKFWVVFELFTVALLIYSAFAALYYAKYTVTDYDDYDYFFKKRSSRSLEQQTFLGLSADKYIRIFEAIANGYNKFSR